MQQAQQTASAVAKALVALTCMPVREKDYVKWNYDFLIPFAEVPNANMLSPDALTWVMRQFRESNVDIDVVRDTNGQPCFEIHHHKMRGQTQT